MRVSIWELGATYRNFFLAAGYHHGQAEDAASILSWLDVQGFDGLGKLCKRKQSGQGFGQRRNLRIERRDGDPIVNCGKASLLSLGSSVVDYAIAERADKGGAPWVLFEEVEDLSFALGLSGLIEKRNESIEMIWQSEGKRTAARYLNDVHKLEMSEAPLVLSNHDAKPPQLWVRCLGPGEAWTGSDEPSARQAAVNGLGDEMFAIEFDGAMGRAYEEGVEVSVERWNFVREFSIRQLVPDTDESRSLGAGMGAEDE